jgi:hypothetical protein
MPCERQQNASAESRRISETAVFIGDFADLSNYLRTEENADKHFSISNPEGQARFEARAYRRQAADFSAASSVAIADVGRVSDPPV